MQGNILCLNTSSSTEAKLSLILGIQERNNSKKMLFNPFPLSKNKFIDCRGSIGISSRLQIFKRKDHLSVSFLLIIVAGI